MLLSRLDLLTSPSRCQLTFKVSVAAREKRAVMVEVSGANEAGN